MSQCDEEQDFLQETYETNYFTLTEAEFRVLNGNFIALQEPHIEKLQYSGTKRFKGCICIMTSGGIYGEI